MVLPLEGTRVIDLSEEISGPYCSMQLADFGAEVIKIEPLSGDWARSLGVKIKGESALFLALNRNKKSIAVDVSTARGKRIVLQLLEKADIFIESFMPGQAEKSGFGYKKLSRTNHGLVYCSISAFGSSGPYKSRPASELEIQGMAGYQWYMGEPGEDPVRVGSDVASMAAGQSAFMGILAALFYRIRTGSGQKVETSMMDALVFCGTAMYAAHYNPDLWGGFMCTGPYDHPETGYQTKDKPIVFGNLSLRDRGDKAWIEFCQKVGLEGLLKDPFFFEFGKKMVGIGRDAQEWKPLMETAFENRTAEELKEIVETSGGQAGIFKNYEEIFNEPQVHAVEMVREIEHPVAGTIKVTGIPFKMEGTPGEIRTPPPTLGQHTDTVLTGLGYSRKEINSLKRAHIVA
jgi:crotonobetainyl-CoA:carnitine CoA-transferase CaiB-like acyl-CoA transferase